MKTKTKILTFIFLCIMIIFKCISDGLGNEITNNLTLYMLMLALGLFLYVNIMNI